MLRASVIERADSAQTTTGRSNMTGRLPPLNALRSFSAAAEMGSFTKAGEVLFVSQGAVSRQVKQLESWVGKPLFLRTAQGLELTDAGRRLAATVASAFGEIESVADDIKKTADRLLLTVNLPPTFATRWLAPRLASFRRLHPLIDFAITTEPARRPRDLKGADAAVVFSDDAWSGYLSDRLRLERHVLVASPTLWAHGSPPALQDCTLLHILDGATRMPVWERWCADHGLPGLDTQSGLAFSTLDQVISAALAGAGVAIVDEAMVQPELHAGTLRRLNLLSTDGAYGYWFVSLTQDPARRAAVQLFRDWLDQQS
jgi:LysR family transcriptional regulator, glycine cleavage system transcriptional activator